MLESLRQEVCEGNLMLPRSGLVTWTSGNVSGRDSETGHIVIKPSGIRYEELAPDKLVIVTLDGQIVEGDLKPSVDTATHLVIYRRRPDVMGVVHTHSTFATAFGDSVAILMKNHGVFTIGQSVMAAVKAAVMTEDVARTVYYALQLGQPQVLAAEEVARGHRQYLEKYGQQ